MQGLSKAFSGKFDWGRYLSWARLLLGTAALVPELFSPERSTLLIGSLAVYVVYGLFSVLKRPAPSGPLGLLETFADTVLFLIMSVQGAALSVWMPPVFYLYLLTRVLALYGPREVSVVVAISVVFCVLAARGSRAAPERTVLVAGVLAWGCSISRKRLQDRIGQLTAEAGAAREEAKQVREAERQRIASDFHDGPLQSFISLQMRLEIVRKLLERDLKSGAQELQKLQELARSQVRELRVFLRAMRPVELDGTNLATSARRVVENFQKESGISVNFVGGDAPLAVAPEICAEVLQMLREALHNVQKHAGASRVAVVMEKLERVLEISVDDNGRGFHFSGVYNLDELEMLQLGPESLKRRARGLNADLVLESRPGQGAGLKMRIPA